LSEPPFTTSVYRELHALAALQLADQKAGHTLQPTALVHEAYLRIAKLETAGAAGRRQFYALAGKVMRSVLVDHARRRLALKRQGGEQIELSTSVAGPEGRPIDVLALNDAIERLQELDPQLVQIVDLLLFAGMTAAEAGEILDVSSRTVERGWRTARAFLRQQLDETTGGGDDRRT
jgi:RNA polymerase sigma factor (TIGR02999 family)